MLFNLNIAVVVSNIVVQHRIVDFTGVNSGLDTVRNVIWDLFVNRK